MTDQSKKDTCCPFWDKYKKRTCQLVESGLFIPTHEHILHYCENELYIKCYHYVGMRQEILEESSGKSEERYIKNRRFYTRIPTSEKLLVTRYSMAREADEDVLDDQAMVLDLSLGGMRIETNAPIHENQIISFTFDEKFQPPHFKGKGEIRWIEKQRPHAGAPGNAGLAFVDDETKNTVREHLLGMGERLLHLSGM